MNTYPTPQNQCPYCGAKLDSASDITPNGQPRPAQLGDICVCLYCAEALELTPDGTYTQATLKTLMDLDKKEMDALGKVQAAIRKKRPGQKQNEKEEEKSA